MNEHLVSICIPTYNGSKYIKATIDSVLAQTYKSIEIIVTDDCSEDDTVKIIKDNYPEVKLTINEKHLGLTGNWNQSVSLATGAYIKLMGQDDILAPNAIELQVKSIEKEVNVVLSLGKTHVINGEGEMLMTRNLAKKDFVCNGITFARKSLWYRNIFCEPSNILYRADIKMNYDSQFIYVPDWDHNIAIAIHGKVSYISQPVMYFRISSSSETSRLYKDKIKILNKDTDLLIEKYREVLSISGFQILCFRTFTRARNLARYYYLRLRR